MTDEEAEFLHRPATRCCYARGFALKGSDEYCAAPAQFWRDRAIEAARSEADAYFLSCANISVFPVIEEIEQKLGRPVVTSNQAVIWEALTLLGVERPAQLSRPAVRTLGATETATAKGAYA